MISTAIAHFKSSEAFSPNDEDDCSAIAFGDDKHKLDSTISSGPRNYLSALESDLRQYLSDVCSIFIASITVLLTQA